ncbi:MAG: hypothetical protein V4649_07735 [Bacteroidota bacterium]
MKFRYFVPFLLVLVVAFSSCEKKTMSKIPLITLSYFGPGQIKVNTDTAFLKFTLQDGDADLGQDQNNIDYDIYIKDARYDSTYIPYYFPEISPDIKDPKKGLEGSCIFKFTPDMIVPRFDSLHKNSDTTSFEIYIMDRAGNKSNHIITPQIIVTI